MDCIHNGKEHVLAETSIDFLMTKLAFHCLLLPFSALRHTVENKAIPLEHLYCFHVYWNRRVSYVLKDAHKAQNKYRIFQAFQVMFALRASWGGVGEETFVSWLLPVLPSSAQRKDLRKDFF